ncbi:ABC transporter substrate-binding protein [uncultured Clostridium sp.]|jgi:NitT/TauT family transport system substrate-binding protein|uniref:ABC transporter substrate-binding protein n=1 Tax=uncultured Clostridium sp. TaxID=59620 RepID=UPI002639DE25|nr:ABC transporter substrate-binding protein [uncultured Clostridium sp.]
MKKITILLVTTMLMGGILTGCQVESSISIDKDDERELTTDISQIHNLDIVIPRGTTSLAMSLMIESDDEKNNIDTDDAHNLYDLEYEITESTDVLMTAVMKGEPDIAIVPSNIALKAYNSGMSYELLGTIGFGSLYLISTNGDENFDDIKGKEVFNIGKGLTPDIVFKTLLDKKGIKEEDVKFSYVGGATELAPTILSGKAEYAIVPEPVLSVIMAKNKNIKIIASLNDVWKESFNSENGFPQSSIIIKSDLAQNKEFVDKFGLKLDKSVDEVNENPVLAAVQEIKNGSKFENSILESSIKRAEIDFIKVNETIDDYNDYYKILNKLNPQSIGKKLPDDEFFYEK